MTEVQQPAKGKSKISPKIFIPFIITNVAFWLGLGIFDFVTGTVVGALAIASTGSMLYFQFKQSLKAKKGTDHVDSEA